MPARIAENLIARYGLPEVEGKLTALGWVWRAQDREWRQDNIAFREAA